jgi:molecular chaperone GrpE
LLIANENELRSEKEQVEKLKKLGDEAEFQKNQIEEKLTILTKEYENFRRRTTEEKVSIKEMAISKAVTELLPALDSLENALGYADSNGLALLQGVEMTLKLLRDGFCKIGVAEIETKDVKFDPEKHNAVAHIDDETLGDSAISKVYQKGYAIGDKVIRHSMVEVAN